ncbi:conserved Plasmodium protein, unknown function [Plasmodium knowlesi strain H]|uniref:F-box domain-containing protein n=3 Tax=Plasmodium knowlesi TaxID=5850 RepID=A0A5K1UZG7_PLAKH|nr:conserved Plasmodium protein, unknown function [Plasmodium knowlesi strain H]OTN64142.1 Uncharacterized protein PKNOH_S140270200 [Plasmodium knowlesi]CAA9991115.1 conserved Plasmodium protein, unknown function [Plasmodium knowlesi strain H]SBO20573.1 conserved Plasmodium protein, unknown function [Plasmodium knowlesi strain H]SBO20967.1 conserved Plasmodium protein, unknown function [Plasmodium knowlesi strain H]VVS80589.1 conserved Plasmodium protein, unknown function [Plasmodium knowlesi |eukprot:XP_002262399.1 hypothetical protein, conserved [Plasmodium knowlesi strain H]
MREGNDGHLLIGISSDAFFNILKFLTLNETLKLKLVCRHFREYIKDEKAFFQNEWICLNNYIRFVRLVHPEKFGSFLVSLLSDEQNVYASPLSARQDLQFGITKKQLLLCDKPFLKKITLKGDFLRNTNLYDISQVLRAHESTLQELHIHGLNDVNCPLFIYSHHDILFDFLSKEVLMNNLSVQRLKKSSLKHIQNLLLQRNGGEATSARLERPPLGKSSAGESPTGELPTGELPTEELPTGELPTEELPTGELPTEELPTGELPTEESSAEESPAEESPAGESSRMSSPRMSSRAEEESSHDGPTERVPIGRDKKVHLLCEHIGVVYNLRKRCFEKIQNYKPKLHLSNYISSLSCLEVMNLSGIQSYDMIEMMISVQLPSLKTLNISCYDYFFYFYHMVVSICLYGSGKEVFSRYLDLKNMELNREKNERKRSEWYERNKEMRQLIKETDEEVIQVNKISTACQKRYEEDVINYYALNVSRNDKKIFFTPTYKDRICMRGINRPVHYADGSYICHDSDGEPDRQNSRRDDEGVPPKARHDQHDQHDQHDLHNLHRQHTHMDQLSQHAEAPREDSPCSTLRSVGSSDDSPYSTLRSVGSEASVESDQRSEYRTEEKASPKGTPASVPARAREPPCQPTSRHTVTRVTEGKLKKLKRGGYIWLVENQKHKKNISIEMLYLCKNIIEKEEKKGRKNIICLMNNLNVEHFSLFNYGLSSPFLWLLLLIRCEKIKTLSILDLCLSHLLSALTFLEAYLKQHLFNFQGMMRRRRKRLGSIYFRFNDEEDINFINRMYSRIINELNLSNFGPRKNRVLHIVIYVYNNKKENKQFVKYIRKISRSLWRCNYVVHYSIQYYKYKYFNRYFDIDNLYRDYVMNVLLTHHKLNQRLISRRALLPRQDRP